MDTDFCMPDDSKHKCQNCGRIVLGKDLRVIRDLDERIYPGETVPSGECPHCLALTSVYKRRRHQTVHVATVHHKHGTDVYVDWTKRGLISQLAEFAKDWWSDYCDGKMPRGKKARVEQYFEAANGHEWADMTEVGLPRKN